MSLDKQNPPQTRNENRFRKVLSQRFSLLRDKADDEVIEQRIRSDTDLSGATSWILMFAILVASIGLNVNSAAVIIGAMLISPLMGPIMGAGMGVALYDFDLVKKALSNLAIATLISLVVSTLYFTLSPLSDAQSELLARTSPTIWDVMIALFGGAAGIIGVTRKEKSNVIPGVAIATALMPPVCTAGFSSATGNWHYFGGALYLYAINCVFISLATIIGIRVLQLKRPDLDDPKISFRVKVYLSLLALGTALPSAYLATQLVREEVFKNKATQFVTQEFNRSGTYVAKMQINPNSRVIEVALIGDALSKATLDKIEAQLSVNQLEGAQIVVHQNGENSVDVTSLKSTFLGDLYKNTQKDLEQKQEQVQKLQAELDARNQLLATAQDMSNELKALYPNISDVFVGQGIEFGADGSGQKILQLSVKTKNRPSKTERTQIEDWFKVRAQSDHVRVTFE